MTRDPGFQLHPQINIGSAISALLDAILWPPFGMGFVDPPRFFIPLLFEPWPEGDQTRADPYFPLPRTEPKKTSTFLFSWNTNGTWRAWFRTCRWWFVGSLEIIVLPEARISGLRQFMHEPIIVTSKAQTRGNDDANLGRTPFLQLDG